MPGWAISPQHQLREEKGRNEEPAGELRMGFLVAGPVRSSRSLLRSMGCFWRL